jgi:hypothetical protein
MSQEVLAAHAVGKQRPGNGGDPALAWQRQPIELRDPGMGQVPIVPAEQLVPAIT